jgi:hypothetical protein
MPVLSRILLLLLAIVGGLLLIGAAAAIWAGTAWGIGGSDTLRLEVGLQGSDVMRMRFASAAGVLGVVILSLGVIGAFAQSRTVTMWIGGQHGVRVPAEVVERYMRIAIDGMKDVEQAKVRVTPAGPRATAVTLDLLVAPEADTAAATAGAEARLESVLTPSCAVLLEGRPNIAIRHASRASGRRSHQVA